MGTSLSVANNQVTQASTLQLYQNTQTQCFANQENKLTNQTFTITNSRTGDINILQKGQASASCIIDNNLGSVSKQILDNIQATTAQTGKAGFLGFGVGIQVTNATTQQDIETYLSQNIVNLCSAQQTNFNNNVIYSITNSETGDINVEQTGDAGATCAITNLANAQAYAQGQSENDNQAGGRDGGLIATVVTVIVIVVIITLLVGFAAKLGKKKTPECVPYPCDFLTGQAYLDCTAINPPFDSVTNCAPLTTSSNCLAYPCDLLTGQDYLDCVAKTPFDATVYCAPTV